MSTTGLDLVALLMPVAVVPPLVMFLVILLVIGDDDRARRRRRGQRQRVEPPRPPDLGETQSFHPCGQCIHGRPPGPVPRYPASPLPLAALEAHHEAIAPEEDILAVLEDGPPSEPDRLPAALVGLDPCDEALITDPSTLLHC